MRLGTLAPLRHRDFRLLAGSLVATLFGAGMLIVALVWQVVALGGGPGELAWVTGGNAAGILLTALPGGVVADRVPQRHVLLLIEAGKTLLVAGCAALSLAGLLEVWHLVVLGVLAGAADGLYYPAYSALLPALLPADDLLAANGLEGIARPVLFQAGGPAAAGALLSLASPGVALVAVAVATAAAAAFLVPLPVLPVARDRQANGDAAGTASDAASEADGRDRPLRAIRRDLVGRFAYVVRTPWLHATLAFAALSVFLIMGPFEVLIPFAIKDRAGGGPAEHALVLAAFGVGGALGALLVSSGRLPRRYLTTMILLWGLGCLPLVVIGVTSSVVLMALAAVVIGGAFQAATVIWGTLLQRRVPHELLGRVSSLDFFVSLVFMPLSMAFAVPVSAALGLTTTFVIAGTLPTALAVVAILAARLPADEIAHPLDGGRAVLDAPDAPDAA